MYHRRRPDIGNAREMRNVYDAVREHQAERIVALPDADSSLIMPNDIVDLPARIISKLRGFDGVGNR